MPVLLADYEPALLPQDATTFFETLDFVQQIEQHSGQPVQLADVYRFLQQNSYREHNIGGKLVWAMQRKKVPCPFAESDKLPASGNEAD